MWLHRLENQPWNWSDWMRHQHRDDYWKHGSVCEKYSSIKAAVLSIGGWHDGYRNTISHLVENLSAPVKGIVGPWNHKYPHYAGPKPAIGFLQEAKRWWDRWLKDENNGVESDPDYRAYLMDSLAPNRWFDDRPGKWIAEPNWPAANIDNQIWQLGSSGELTQIVKPISVDISSPQNCGATAGEYFPFAFGDELPDDQRVDDNLSTCFTGPTTTEITDIVGAPNVRFNMSCDRAYGQVAVRLCDQRPDGTSALITMGVFNLAHHKSHEKPIPLVEGEVIEIEFTLDQIAYRLPAGHNLLLAISNSYFPTIWPSPEITSLTLLGGSVSIPVRPTAEADEWRFEEPIAAPEWRHEALRPSNYSKDIYNDSGTGETVTEIFSDFGENRDLEHGLISGSWVKERFSVHPDNPLSARCIAEWEQTGGREGQMWRTHCRGEMWSDRTHFFSKATLTAFLNDDQVFNHVFDDKVERNLV